MQRLITMFACTILTGCASYVDIVGAHYNERDPCQNARNVADWTMPSFCGRGSSRIITRKIGTDRYESRIQP